jgi:hypothetical protein
MKLYLDFFWGYGFYWMGLISCGFDIQLIGINITLENLLGFAVWALPGWEIEIRNLIPKCCQLIFFLYKIHISPYFTFEK